MTTSPSPLAISATPGCPIACDMTDATDTPDERIAEHARLFAHALVARERIENGVVLTFAAKPGAWEWIADLVRREAACCPFFSYEVELRDDEIVWTTSSESSPAVDAYFDELYAGPERLVGDGFDGLLADSPREAFTWSRRARPGTSSPNHPASSPFESPYEQTVPGAGGVRFTR